MNGKGKAERHSKTLCRPATIYLLPYHYSTHVILSIFLGGLGVDRFYVGDVGLGIAKLLFGWITFGIWPFIDIFVSYKKARIKNFENIMAVL